MELARYIVLNPVRAKMVEFPEEWRWTSYVAMGNRRVAPDWLEVDGMLAYRWRPTEICCIDDSSWRVSGRRARGVS